MITVRPPQNSRAEIDAFDRTCDRLSGFNAELSFERVDGFLAALAAGPRLPDATDWLPALCGDDTFERVFADPEDHAQALRALQARLKLLGQLLDPEQLFEQPDQLRLEPWVMDWNDEDRQRLINEGGLSAEEAAEPQLGAVWAAGFLSAVAAFPALWEVPPDEDAQATMADAIALIGALTLPADSDALQAHIAAVYRDAGSGERRAVSAATPAEFVPPNRDDMLADACLAVQDLRMLWVDFAQKPATRRVEAMPGRNEPCFCGSGRKYKKCHGAAA